MLIVVIDYFHFIKKFLEDSIVNWVEAHHRIINFWVIFLYTLINFFIKLEESIIYFHYFFLNLYKK